MRKLKGNRTGHTSFIEMLAPLLFIGVVVLIIGVLSIMSGQEYLGFLISVAGLIAIGIGYVGKRGGHF
jgi:hypothetical protein